MRFKRFSLSNPIFRRTLKKEVRYGLPFFGYFTHTLWPLWGSSMAAFLAGYHPKKMPVKEHTAKLMIILHS